MALHRRDLIDGLSSFASNINSQFDSAVGITTSASTQATTTGSVKSTTSLGSSTTSAKATSTAKSTAASSSKSTDSTSTSTDNAAASSSTITSTSSTASTSTIASSPPLSSGSSISSTTSSSTLTTSTNPTPTSTALASATNDGNRLSTAGIAVAAIFALLILSGVIYLLWKYLPAARRYRERAYQARSHRKGLCFDDGESTHMHFDDPKAGLGLRKFSFHAAPTYYPGQPHEPDLSQQQPLTSASSEDHVVSPLSTRSIGSLSQDTLPRALRAGPTSYMPYPYPDVRASQIGVAVPIRSPSPREMEKGLPPLPLPSIGYGRPFS